MKKRKCAICEKTISTDRLEIRPNVLTCSKACSTIHKKNYLREYQREYRKRVVLSGRKGGTIENE